ncbi:MAG: hypothetical protein JO352_30500 [Chloroflexi bacterium]|nr:hypothetical protein [Chloroflexota bacterium]MBV9601737.1 hypothetical protein [Chloroflexota bacterium]
MLPGRPDGTAGGWLAAKIASRRWVRTWTPRLLTVIVSLELARLTVGPLLMPP